MRTNAKTCVYYNVSESESVPTYLRGTYLPTIFKLETEVVFVRAGYVY